MKNSNSIRVVFQSLLILITLLPHNILAQSQMWTVKGVNGSAWQIKDDKKLPLKLNDQIPDNTVVQTGSMSRLVLQIGQDEISLSQHSRLKLNSAKTGNNNRIVDFINGKMRATVEKQSDKNQALDNANAPRFRVRTQAAVVGVRGTEFFIQSEGRNDFVCTLNGLVEVTSVSTQQKILVPPKAGVKISQGAGMELNPTPDVLIDRWVNDTSLTETKTVVMDEYPFLSPTEHPWRTNIYFGISSQLNLGFTDNLNYNSLQNDDKNSFLQLRLTPALRFGEKTALTWRPWWILHQSEDPMILDADPALVEDSNSQFATGELYFSHHAEKGSVYLGLQSIKWNDGILFSRNFWNADPFVFPAIYTKYTSGPHYLDAFYALEGERDKQNGQVPAEIYAIKYDYQNWLSIFAAQRNYTDDADLFLNHEITDVGFFSNRRIKNFEYKTTLIYQNGTLFQDVPTAEFDSTESMYDLALSFYSPKRPWKLTVTSAQASENFLAGFESPYNLGYSRIFTRTNLKQTRVRLSHARAHKNLYAYLEWIKYESVGSSNLVNWSGSNELAQEWDLSIQVSRNANRSTLLTLFYVDPTNSMSSSSPTWSEDSGFGGILNIQWQK